MSKIQKAIRDIEKGTSDEAVPKKEKILGRLIDNKADSSFAVGDETRQMAAMHVSEPSRRIELNRETLMESGFIAPEEEERKLTDQFRQIKQPLVAHAFGKRATKIEDGHLILVTSALSGDGKTFSCINLALSLAREKDRSVLLVDADVAKQHVSHLFGVRDQPGLMDLLTEEPGLNLGNTILATDVEGLSVLPSGKVHAHSTEMLSSNRMEQLIRALTLQDPNRIVLFDSSPLLSTSESRVLATLVGQIVMIVCAGKTPKQAILESVALIDEGKALNMVLNQARHGAGEEYYGYGYGGAGGIDEEYR